MIKQGTTLTYICHIHSSTTHTHTHRYTYIHIYMYTRVCVCVYRHLRSGGERWLICRYDRLLSAHLAYLFRQLLLFCIVMVFASKSVTHSEPTSTGLPG